MVAEVDLVVRLEKAACAEDEFSLAVALESGAAELR